MIKNSLPAATAAVLLCACAAQTKPPAPQMPQAASESAGRSGAAPGQVQAPAAAQPAPLPQQGTGQAPAAPMQGKGELQMTSGRIGEREALAFRVPVGGDGSALRLSPDAERSLAAIAVRAERVQLRETFEGGTAADYTPDMRDERLRAARAFLVERGVPADRIEIAKSPRRPPVKPGSSGQGPAVEILLQLPEPGAPLGR